jgi:hypothetical protein
MAMPPRHGVDWSRAGRSPITEADLSKGYLKQITSNGKIADENTPSTAIAGIVPVHVLHAFYQSLPESSMQQVVRTLEAEFTASVVSAGSLNSAVTSVPPQFVYVITDVLYYAIQPSSFLEAPPIALEEHQVAGFLRFNIEIGNRQPLSMGVATHSRYDAPGTTAYDTQGWPFVNSVFGSRRGGGFALYARSSQTINMVVNIDVAPRFMITHVGMHLHGFAVPEAEFDDVFRRIKGK